MEGLLITAIVLITLAIVAQASILTLMYRMSRRLTEKAEALIDQSHTVMAPLESITANLKTVG